MILFIPTILMFIAGIISWLAYGLHDLMSFTYNLANWCQSILIKCMPYYDSLKVLFLWIAAIIFVSGLVYALIRAFHREIIAYSALKRLPLVDRGLSVILIRDQGAKAAFTSGLIRPRIYISTGLLKELTREEIKAVLLHEACHRRAMDPLRIFLVTMMREVFFYLPIGGYIFDYIHSFREYAADDAVVIKTGSVLEISSALLKLARCKKEYMPETSLVSIVGSGIIERRIRRLVEKGDIQLKPPSIRTFASSALLMFLMSLLLSIPLFESSRIFVNGCNNRHCSASKELNAKNCKSHCDKSAQS